MVAIQSLTGVHVQHCDDLLVPKTAQHRNHSCKMQTLSGTVLEQCWGEVSTQISCVSLEVCRLLSISGLLCLIANRKQVNPTVCDPQPVH